MVHLLIRAAMRFVGYGDRKAVAAALRPIYTAPNAVAARRELDAFADSTWGKNYPHSVATWNAAWGRFTPFLAFSPELRRVIYTTNAIESMNHQLQGCADVRSSVMNSVSAAAAALIRLKDPTGQAAGRGGVHRYDDADLTETAELRLV